MKRFTLLTAGAVCALAYTSSAFAAEAAADAASESVDPSLSGVMPVEETGNNVADPAKDSDADMEEAGSANEREAKNAIYLDLAGPGLFYSVNYDRVLTGDISARIGFSYFAISASTESGDGSGASGKASYFAIPLTVSYLGLGSESNMFELGAGGVILNFKGEGIVDVEEEEADASAGVSASYTTVGLTALAGYRHQPADGGFVFRIGASPVLIPGVILLPTAYMSFGAAF